jgi:hypothetical protein
MRRVSAVFILASGLTIMAAAPSSLLASNLYQWTGKDGTPTYSPDPPPDGVAYQLVGPDLQPLSAPASQSTTTEPAKTASTPAASQPTTAATPAVSQPAAAPVAARALPKNGVAPLQPPASAKPAAPVKPWKPVRYADDPNPTAKATKKAEISEAANAVVTARTSTPCVNARQKMVLLESQFAQAVTDKQMDKAILQLRDHQTVVQKACNPG